MLEAETADTAAGTIGFTGEAALSGGGFLGTAADGGELQDGTQGLFQAITTRGHQTSGVVAGGGAGGLIAAGLSAAIIFQPLASIPLLTAVGVARLLFSNRRFVALMSNNRS